jgi:hypothetical protein
MASNARKQDLARRLAAIRSVRGLLRPKPGEPSFAEQMAIWKAEGRAEEKRRDELHSDLCAGRSLAIGLSAAHRSGKVSRRLKPRPST